MNDDEIPQEEIDKIMEEKDCDKETAWSLYQDRQERDQIKQTRNIIEEQEKKDKENATLTKVYEVLDKYLYLPDKRRVDLILAIALSKKELGTPLWLVIVGSSGDAKSEIIRAIEKYQGTIKIDQITPNTLASGKPDVIKDKKTGQMITLPVVDLGSSLQNKSTLLLIPDLAVFSSKNTDDKQQIWAQFRNLYDGFINKRTGTGVNRAYENCHVTLIGCSTPVIRDEFIVHAQLGTRELMWDTGLEKDGNPSKEHTRKHKTLMAWSNEKYEEQMRKEVADIVLNFLKFKKFKRIPDEEISDEIRDYFIEEANRLSTLRASVMIDQTHREVNNPVIAETPTRLIKQFKRIYMSMKSLDDNYNDDKIKEIIKILVDSTGNTVRQMIMETLRLSFNRELTIKDIQMLTKIGRNSVKTQLEILWNLGVIEKEIKSERIGAYCYAYDDSYGHHEEMRGGMIKEIEYYKWKINVEA